MNREEYYRGVLALVAAEAGKAGLIVVPPLADLRAGVPTDRIIDLTDVLPQLEASEIEAYLSRLVRNGSKIVVVASVYYSDTVLSDGTNKNKTVEPHGWWENIIRSHFKDSTVLPAYLESDIVLANFTVSKETRARMKAFRGNSSLQKEWRRFVERGLLAYRQLSGIITRQEDLLRDLAGKSVAVVGNSRSLGQMSYGEQIDGHDIVIRFNRVPIVSRRSHGFRTDWVATGVPIEQSRLDELGANRLLWLSAFRRKMTSGTIGVRHLYLHPLKDIELLSGTLGVARPSTGVTAIDLLRRSSCRSATLYGFDFYASQSSSSHQTADNNPHSYDREELFVRELLAEDERFDLAS